MERAVIDGNILEYKTAGTGEPVVFIHGALIADTFRPLLSEPVLANRYQLILHRRRGYGGSSWTGRPVTYAEQAADCRALLRHLGIERAQVVGHSYGGTVALQLALDAPTVVYSLVLLETGLMVGGSAASYRAALMQGVQRYREVGAEVAVDEFMRARWPEYREELDRVLPGSFEQAVADAAGWFEADIPGDPDWHFGETEGRRVTQPALVVLGENSIPLHPRFEETYRALLGWLSNAEGYILPETTHFMQLQEPGGMAQALADFFSRHPM